MRGLNREEGVRILARLANLQPAWHPWAEADAARHEFQVRVPEAVIHFDYAK
jgi:hypothetical protein